MPTMGWGSFQWPWVYFLFFFFSPSTEFFLFAKCYALQYLTGLNCGKLMSAYIPFLKGQCHAVWVELQYGKSHLKSKKRKTSAKDSFARPLNLLVHWIRIQLRMARMEKGWDFANVFKFWTRYIKKKLAFPSKYPPGYTLPDLQWILIIIIGLFNIISSSNTGIENQLTYKQGSKWIFRNKGILIN